MPEMTRMGKRPTVYDVANYAGVSTATVSYAYRKPERVGEATLKRVIKAANDLGYVPRASARELAVGSHDTLGLFAFEFLLEGGDSYWNTERDDSLPDPWVFPLYVDEVQRGFQLECARFEKSALVGSGSANSAEELIAIAGSVDGLVVLPGEVSKPAISLVSKHIPVVLISQEPVGNRTLGVSIDNQVGVELLVNHLFDVHGVTDIGFIGVPDEDEVGSRFEHFRSAMARRGLDTPEEPWACVEVVSVESGRALAARLSQDAVPRALICAQDQIAWTAVQALQRAGCRIPEDVIVVGFDGVLAGQYMSPALTTVRQPMEAMGRKAVQLLLNPPDQAEERSYVFEPTLVVRNSCGCL